MATGRRLAMRRRLTAITVAWLLGSLISVGGGPTTLGADPKPEKPARLMAEEGGTTTAVAADASVVPAGFTDSAILAGLTAPIAVRFSPDGRVFVAEKSGLIKVFANLTSAVGDGRRGPADPGRQLLGPRSARVHPGPRVSDDAVCLRPVRVRRAGRGHGAGLERRVSDAAGPDHRRLRRQWPPVADHDHGQRDDRRRAGARQRLVPAVPQPFGRRAPVRAGRRAVRDGRRRCELGLP